MATAPALLTVEQYLHTSFHPDVDFVDGEIEERNLGEFDHGRLQGLLFAWFQSRERAFGVVGVLEQRIRVAGTRVRICDVTLLRRSAPREAVTTTPPLICIEVLSPEERLSRAEIVLRDYLGMGVENIWLIDPIRRVAYVFDQHGLQQATNNILRVEGTEIVLEVDILFEDLDEARG